MQKILWVFLLIAALAIPASAKPEFLDLFKAHYKIADGSKLANAACNICHSQPPRRNAYGRMLQGEMKKANTRTLTEAILLAAETQSAAGDGVSNGDKIKADTLPAEGNPNAVKPKDEPKKEEAKDAPLIPTHTFHPTVVHFPIALFIFGAFLDFVGARKGRELWRQAGYLNFVFALISTLVVLPTGLIAMLRLGYPIEGTMLYHLILAIVSTILMGTVVSMRKKEALNTPAYWLGLLIAVVVLGITGHLGGTLVFG